MRALQFFKAGNVAALRRWVGKVGFNEALPHVAKHVGSTERAKKIVGKLKGMAKKKGELAPEHAYGRSAKKGAMLKDGAEGAEGKPPASPATTDKDVAEPARKRNLTGGAGMGAPLVPGDHYEPDEDQLGGPLDGDDDNQMRKGEYGAWQAGGPIARAMRRKARRDPTAFKRPEQPKAVKPYQPTNMPRPKSDVNFAEPPKTPPQPPQKPAKPYRPTNMPRPKSDVDFATKACGPKAIGTTRSGKDVFGVPSHQGHWKYTAEDHDDAARLHEQAGRGSEAAQHRHKARKLRSNGYDTTGTFAKARGEGSRGGKVVGHTRSGKPVYFDPHMTAYSKFSAEDHEDAAAAHNAALDTIERQGREGDAATKPAWEAHAKGAEYHRKEAGRMRAQPPAGQGGLFAEKPTITRPKKTTTFAEKLQGTLDKQRKRHEDTQAAMAQARARAETRRAGGEKIPEGAINIMDLIGKASLYERQRAFLKGRGRGEGSRGGKIIGHTRSGKPIYDRIQHGNGHMGFTSADHRDAIDLHRELATDRLSHHHGEAEYHKQRMLTQQERESRDPDTFDERTKGWSKEMHDDAIVHHHRAGGGGLHMATTAEHQHRWERDRHDAKFGPDEFRSRGLSQVEEGDTIRHYDRDNKQVHHRVTRVDKHPLTGVRTVHLDDGRTMRHDPHNERHDPMLDVRPGERKPAPTGPSQGGLFKGKTLTTGCPSCGKQWQQPPKLRRSPVCLDCRKKAHNERFKDPGRFTRGGRMSLVERQRAFLKGGEGSRGGQVIGHTRSGKPVYSYHQHPAHGNFSRQDHRDAAELHRQAHAIAPTAHAQGGGLQQADAHERMASGTYGKPGETHKQLGRKAHADAAHESVHGEPAEQYRRGDFKGWTAKDHDDRANVHHTLGAAANDHATETAHDAMTPQRRQAYLDLADKHFTHASYHDGHAYRLRQQEQRQTPRGQLRAYMNREPGARMPGTKPPPKPELPPGTQGSLFTRKASLFDRQRAFLRRA